MVGITITDGAADTDGAAEKIRAFLVGTKAGQGLGVQILEGSCSGFEHKLGIDSPESEDHVFETPAPVSCSTRRASFISMAESSIIEAG